VRGFRFPQSSSASRFTAGAAGSWRFRTRQVDFEALNLKPRSPRSRTRRSGHRLPPARFALHRAHRDAFALVFAHIATPDRRARPCWPSEEISPSALERLTTNVTGRGKAERYATSAFSDRLLDLGQVYCARLPGLRPKMSATSARARSFGESGTSPRSVARKSLGRRPPCFTATAPK